MPTGQQYATNVPQTTLTGSVNASATSLSVASSASWPSVPFTAVLDIGTSSQEPVDVTTVVGTTWTVTRNIDGTTGFSHAIGATVTHADIGRDFREARTHMDASTNVHGLTGGAAVVGDTQTQTLTNKTITSPSIGGTVAGGASYTSPSLTGTVGGSATYTTPKLDRPVIGSTSPASPSGTDLAMFSSAGALLIRDASGTFSAVTPQTVSASANLLGAWSHDAVNAVGTFLLTSGVIYYSEITVTALISVSQIGLFLASGGSGLTANQNIAGLYTAAGTRLAVTADQSGVWNGSAGFKGMSIASQTLEPGRYFVGILSNGTTPASFSFTNTGSIVNAGVGSTPFRATQSAGGQTALPTTTAFSGTSVFNGLIWASIT